MSSPRTGHERTREYSSGRVFSVFSALPASKLSLHCSRVLWTFRASRTINSRKREPAQLREKLVSRIERRVNNCARRKFPIVCTRHVSLAQRYVIKENAIKSAHDWEGRRVSSQASFLSLPVFVPLEHRRSFLRRVERRTLTHGRPSLRSSYNYHKT